MNQGTILGSHIGKWIILAAWWLCYWRSLFTASVVRAQEDSTAIEYAENGEGPVATFTATDPEGVTPIAWSVPTNADMQRGHCRHRNDADDADNERLHHRQGRDAQVQPSRKPTMGPTPGSPDFENGSGQRALKTTTTPTSVVVVACDVALGTDDACLDPGKAGYHKVTVKVTDVAETGKVTWTVNHNAGTPRCETFWTTALRP